MMDFFFILMQNSIMKKVHTLQYIFLILIITSCVTIDSPITSTPKIKPTVETKFDINTSNITPSSINFQKLTDLRLATKYLFLYDDWYVRHQPIILQGLLNGTKSFTGDEIKLLEKANEDKNNLIKQLSTISDSIQNEKIVSALKIWRISLDSHGIDQSKLESGVSLTDLSQATGLNANMDLYGALFEYSEPLYTQQSQTFDQLSDLRNAYKFLHLDQEIFAKAISLDIFIIMSQGIENISESEIDKINLFLSFEEEKKLNSDNVLLEIKNQNIVNSLSIWRSFRNGENIDFSKFENDILEGFNLNDLSEMNTATPADYQLNLYGLMYKYSESNE